MLSVMYIDRVPDLARTAVQLIAHVRRRKDGDQSQPSRSARVEQGRGRARVARWQHGRSHNACSKGASLSTRIWFVWIRDHRSPRRSLVRRCRLTADKLYAGRHDAHETIGHTVRTNSSSLAIEPLIVASSSWSAASSSRSGHCCSGAWPRPELWISPRGRSNSRLMFVRRSGKADKAIQSSAKYGRRRFPRDPPSFGRRRKKLGHRHANRRRRAVVPILPISTMCPCRYRAEGSVPTVAIGAVARPHCELEHAKNATNFRLKQTQSKGAQRPSGLIA
jgi:hypothetical protein